jgi:hypothetical protein
MHKSCVQPKRRRESRAVVVRHSRGIMRSNGPESASAVPLSQHHDAGLHGTPALSPDPRQACRWEPVVYKARPSLHGAATPTPLASTTHDHAMTSPAPTHDASSTPPGDASRPLSMATTVHGNDPEPSAPRYSAEKAQRPPVSDEKDQNVVMVDWEGPDDPKNPRKCVSSPCLPLIAHI